MAEVKEETVEVKEALHVKDEVIVEYEVNVEGDNIRFYLHLASASPVKLTTPISAFKKIQYPISLSLVFLCSFSPLPVSFLSSPLFPSP